MLTSTALLGYGHLYPISTGGKVATIIYAICGIPLVLSILDDLGRLLTVTLKYPWLLVKVSQSDTKNTKTNST